MIEPTTYWERFQIENYGDILEKKSEADELENGHDDKERNDRLVDEHFEHALNDLSC